MIPFMLQVLRLAWKYLEKVLRFVGKVQSTLLLSLAYYLVLGPVAIVYQLIRGLRAQPATNSFWRKRGVEQDTEETLVRQF